MKVAIIHDWLTGMRGGEKVLEVLCELFPEADLYTLLHIKGSVSPTIEGMDIRTSFVQKLPFVNKRYRYYLPLFPAAIEQFDLRGYDLVISSSHCVAKGVIPPPNACHISYVHTPMRYMWDMYYDYFNPNRTNALSRMIVPLVANYLRSWDVTSSNRVDHFIANSPHVAARIRKYYNREAEVIYPPCDAHRFVISGISKDHYLVVSSFAPYKRIDLAIQAFNRLGKCLKIIGTGEDEKRLKRLAGPTIEFPGWKPDEELAGHYASARALIFPGEEDFGIVPLEAMACGTPVIAYAKGGALETVVPLEGPMAAGQGSSPTGIFFHEQTVESLAQAVKDFEEKAALFSKNKLRKHALTFDRPIFKGHIKKFIDEKYGEFSNLEQARRTLEKSASAS